MYHAAFQMGFLATNMFMGAFSSYFMAGFVMVKVPFGLTNRFKASLSELKDDCSICILSSSVFCS
jgi:hypothetical protein